MCGISGILSAGPVKPGRIENMTRALAHRGPDGEGVWRNRNRRPGEPHVSFGHRRLAIVDLSPAGAQPMTNEDGRFTIVFNGEIYNHAALRSDLSNRHPFRSRSDTEVLLHGWEEEGSAFLERAEGMFAFAIWDASDASLTLGRDRLGEKPLLYAQAGGEFLFASELGALARDPAIRREIDPAALHHYLAWNAIPHPWTILRGVRRLGPGRTLHVAGGKIAESVYWAPGPGSITPADEKEGRARLRASLDKSVRLRLRGDVPVGAFLSGGVDSTIITGLAARASEAPLRTFSVGFKGQSAFDERAFAAEVARFHGTLHTEIVLDPRDALEEVAALLAEIDEPFADSSAVPTSLLCRHARSRVKVALSGDGADELFAGYWKYAGESIAAAYGRVPIRLRRRLARLAEMIPEDRRSARGESLRRMRKFLVRFEPDPALRHVAWMLVFGAAHRRDLLLESGPGGAEKLAPFASPEAHAVEEYRAGGMHDPLGAMLRADLAHTLPADMLAKVDRMSMRHGLEVRVPFLAPEVVSLALAMPSRWKLRGMRRKAVLVDACRDLIPEGLRRRPKRGFELPVAEWFRGPLRPLLEEMLGGDALGRQGVFRPRAVRMLLDDHLARRADHAPRLWNLLVFTAWHQRVMGAAHG
ncbi:MAG: asparagine synthase (glutamine-hydrolyzing) [Myxococcota bacterium]